jgi:hypothetical protein
MRDAEWFNGLRSVPGIGYTGHPDVDRTKVPGYDTKPDITTFDVGEKKHVSVMWPMRDGGHTSQSPASAWSSHGDARTAEPEDVIRSLYEALELPGTISDYHFKMLGTCGVLWSLRKRRPDLLSELERILLLDVSLIQAHGESLVFEHNGDRHMPRVPAFDQLIALYEREGFVHEALAVAKLAMAADQGSADEERLLERLAELQAEDIA